MAELTITTFLTLDGVMQAPGGPTEDTSGNFTHGGWVFPYFDTDMGEIMNGIFEKVDAFLLGHTTYDLFAGHWPKVTDEKDVIAHNLNTLPKYVASRSAQNLTWHNSKPVRDVVPEVKALKERYKREVQVHGSAGLAQTLIENDLIISLAGFSGDGGQRQAPVRKRHGTCGHVAGEHADEQQRRGLAHLPPGWEIENRFILVGA
jgi:dihydrofolate reductase